jgi:diguanylate cyclase (GGDEF)-like protein/PAS domain S-box-containing protein
MRILELIATGVPEERVFDEVVSLVEHHGVNIACAVHRIDEPTKTLRLLRSSKFTTEFGEHLANLPVDPESNVQAAAALNAQVVIVSDWSDEDHWTDQAARSICAGYRSAIVVPISGSEHNVLGTLTIFRVRSGEPNGSHLQRIMSAARLVGVVIEKTEAERALRRAELRYRRLAEEIPAITFVVSADHQLRVTYLSPQAEAVFDPDIVARANQLSLLDLVYPEDRRSVFRSFEQGDFNRYSTLIEFRLSNAGPMERWLQCSAVLLDDNPGEVPCWQGILMDVTARRRAEQTLRESQTQFRALFDNNPHVVVSLDTRGRFQRLNPATRELTGYREEDLIGRPFTSVLVAGEIEHVWQHFRHSLQGMSQQFETEIFTRRGTRLQLNVTCVPFMLDGEVAGVSAIAEDITQRVNLQDQLTHQAFHDGLTGLPNRVLFNERLSQAISNMERSRTAIAVMFVDLDNFKVVNDSLGHESGDEYLKIMSRWLRNCVSPADSVARFGGDEFTVLLVFPRDDQGYPLRVADRIGRELNRPVVIRGHEINTGVSLGISISTEPVSEVHDLLKQADIALYQAKRSGNGVLYRVFEESMHQQIVQRLETQRDLRRAIRRNEFEVHYQPIIDLTTGRVVKVEALVRWRHPERGLLSPVHFLSIAEETGQISDIDWLVMQAACRQIAEWNRSRPQADPILLAINLSVKDFRGADLTERIQQTLRETGCEPSWLTFEITESTMMQDVTIALDVLKRLRQIGIGFSIDDFGTGYSSLAYLQRLPLDTLKIDRSFIDGLGGDDEAELMVRTIISLASALSLEVIAEGIETDLQMERARELGCDRAQGYLFARPVPFEGLIPILLESNGDSLQARLG